MMGQGVFSDPAARRRLPTSGVTANGNCWCGIRQDLSRLSCRARDGRTSSEARFRHDYGRLETLREFCKEKGLEFHAISAPTGQGVRELVRSIADALDKIPKALSETTEEMPRTLQENAEEPRTARLENL